MEVDAMIRPVVEAAGLEFVDAGFHREGGRRILRVIVDRDGGVDLDAIAQASERISRRLDLEGFDQDRSPYSLEVSSPGLERPLTEPRHFARHVGSLVNVKARPGGPGEAPRKIRGTIVEAGEDAVSIATDGGVETVQYADVTSARTVFEWGGNT